MHGSVQGVFFRDGCRRQAERHGVSGWVRNDTAGTVSAVFEGDPAAVEALVRWCRSGPEQAVVEHVDTTTEHPTDETGFAVR